MIQLYKNVLEDDLVKELLDYYQHNLDRLTDYGNFEQVEIDAGHRLSNLMKDLTHKIGDDYFEKHDKTSQAPKVYAVEGFRIKRYEPNQGSFPWHVDAGTIQNCTRFLAFLYYLNDDFYVITFSNLFSSLCCLRNRSLVLILLSFCSAASRSLSQALT